MNSAFILGVTRCKRHFTNALLLTIKLMSEEDKIMTKTKRTLCSLAALFAAGQAFAHTGVRDVVTEGTSSYNGFTITHGCGGDSGQAYPVLGQSAVFPFGATAVWRGKAAGTPGGGDGPILATGGAGITSTGSIGLSVNGYASASSAFVTSQELVDDLNNVRGLFWKDGAMEPKLNTVTPFKVTAPMIADNCIKQLRIRVGVINYCDVEKNAANDASGPYKQPKDAYGRTIPLLAIADVNDPRYLDGFQTNPAVSPVYVSIKAGNGDNNRADWWFGALEGGSALYNDIEVLQPPSATTGIPYWTTMTVNNSAADIAACAGALIDYVTVEPSGADFDAVLTGPNTRPFSKGNSNL
jgi:hypothetical protein